jgi:hypothetical protein
MPPSTRFCTDALEEEIQVYKEVVLASWILAAANVLLYMVCFRRRLAGAPGLASQYFFVTGSMKLVMGILIAVLFLPQCPDNCNQEACGKVPDVEVFYALLVSLVGLVWIQQGYAFLERAQLLENGQSEGAEDTVFQPVSTKDEGEDHQEEPSSELEVVERNQEQSYDTVL